MTKQLVENALFLYCICIVVQLNLIMANPADDTKFIQDYEKFMDAYCGNCAKLTEDIKPETLKKLDECDYIVFSKEGKEMENQCMIESAPKGASVNERRRLWCNNQQFYQKTRNCYSKKLEAKQKTDGHAGEQISEEQLRNDTLRAMECRKRVFKF